MAGFNISAAPAVAPSVPPGSSQAAGRAPAASSSAPRSSARPAAGGANGAPQGPQSANSPDDPAAQAAQDPRAAAGASQSGAPAASATATPPAEDVFASLVESFNESHEGGGFYGGAAGTARADDAPGAAAGKKGRPVAAPVVRGAVSKLAALPQNLLAALETAADKKDDSKVVPVAPPVAAPVPSPLLFLKAPSGAAAPAVKASDDAKPAERLREDAPAIEIRIRDNASSAAAPPTGTPVVAPPVASLQPAEKAPAAVLPAAPLTQAVAAPVEVQHAPAAPLPRAEAAPREAAHVSLPETTAPEAPSTPLRSFSLEFTPDGARDVKLRLSERSGEVHISVHSTDPALTGVLKEGVHDLAGALAHAGYDAEAWSSGQQQQQQQQQEQQRQRRAQGRTDEYSSESFDLGIDGVDGPIDNR